LREDGENPGMGIRFLYESDGQRSTFEGLVEQLMERSLGPTLAAGLLGRKKP
jgi:type IV pilus assembly protein PilZ